MADLIVESLEQLVLEPTPIITGVNFVEFIPDRRCQSVVNKIVLPMADNAGSATVLSVLPTIKTKDLSIKLGRKSIHPRPKLLSNKPLQDFCQRIAFTDFLVTGSLVYKGNYAELCKAMLQDGGSFRQVFLSFAQKTSTTRLD